MSQQVSAPIGAISGSIAKAWGWVLTLGILTLLLGVVVLAWPGATILAVAVLFGVHLLVVGVLAFVAGLIALRAPIETAAILGILQIVLSLQLRSALRSLHAAV